MLVKDKNNADDAEPCSLKIRSGEGTFNLEIDGTVRDLVTKILLHENSIADANEMDDLMSAFEIQ